MPKSSNTSRLIVIEGLDGSGKATQAGLLTESLTAAGTPVRRISFPDYAHKSSIPVQMYLNGEIGSLEEVNVYAASTFYSIDRYISYQTDWSRDCKEGRLILADRYTTSNAVHQASKEPPERRAEFLRWLYDLEYDRLGLPRPDLVLYLDVPVEFTAQLMRHREAETNTHADIHEQDETYLKNCRAAAQEIVRDCGWTVIRCARDDEPRTVEDIHDEVYRTVRALL